MKNTITTDLYEFGWRELKELEMILKAWREHGLPENFNGENVIPHFNKDSGYVFLSNDDYETCLLNGGKLEKWHTCNECGHEGFLCDFEHEPHADECIDCMEEAGISRETIKFWRDKEG